MIEGAVFIFALVLGWGIIKWRSLHKLEQLKAWVHWATSESDFPRYNTPLWQHLRSAQAKTKIPEPYRISCDEEWDLAKKILEEYQKDLMRAFFEERAPAIKEKLSVNENSNTSYFIFSLYVFLCDHQCDYVFAGEKMHGETLEYNSYGSWGAPLFDATYTLTDFALVFHKMLYVTYMSAKGNGLLKDLIPLWKEEKLKENLDTRKIWISRL